MTAQRTSFWARLARALHIRRRASSPATDLPEVGDNGLLAESVCLPGEEEMPAARAAGPLARWSKRDQTLAKLQEGYEQVTQLIEQIRNHLVAQAERSERVASALEQLARSLSDVPALSRQQAETLEAMASQLEMTGARTQQLADSMSELPRIARTQGDTLAGINQQLQVAGEQSIVLSQTMDKLGANLAALGESTGTQAEAMKQMEGHATRQSEALAHLIDRQGRRFVALFVVTLVLVVAAMTLGILGLVLRAG